MTIVKINLIVLSLLIVDIVSAQKIQVKLVEFYYNDTLVPINKETYQYDGIQYENWNKKEG
jgi:hypothetical protein